MFVAALLLSSAMAQGFPDVCLTSPTKVRIGPLGRDNWDQPPVVVDSGSTAYGTASCPGTWTADVTGEQALWVKVKAELMMGSKPPTNQADCERLVVSAKVWYNTNGSWRTLPALEQRATGHWTDRCWVPSVLLTDDSAGIPYRVVARGGRLDANGRETQLPIRVSFQAYLPDDLQPEPGANYPRPQPVPVAPGVIPRPY